MESTDSYSLPGDHAERMARVRLALDGLSVGDAFGECFFHPARVITLVGGTREVPAAPWRYTDDTEMALAIAEVLDAHAGIHQDELARVFARRFRSNPNRGYGATAFEILGAIGRGENWHKASREAFGGEGSMGNGGAMRVAPVGAYFADDFSAAVDHARASAAVTHGHADGQAGAIAVAVAAAWAWQNHANPQRNPQALFETVLEHMPEGGTRRVLVHAATVPFGIPAPQAAAVLGSGQKVVSWDTVPFALWCAARHLDDYAEAMWATVSGLGDRDTTCAIAGGIVALSAGHAGIPTEWLAAREALT
ncbi:MAG TPA: ADP-ribosylglycohydrolase family protein [Gemmataceae bacterium]|jgi:ADP-ribosylglycohydrolase